MRKTDKTPAEIAAMTLAEYLAEASRLRAADVADFRRTMNAQRGVAIIAVDGTADDDDHAKWCGCGLKLGA
jgi:hypothetical protein